MFMLFLFSYLGWFVFAVCVKVTGPQTILITGAFIQFKIFQVSAVIFRFLRNTEATPE